MGIFSHATVETREERLTTDELRDIWLDGEWATFAECVRSIVTGSLQRIINDPDTEAEILQTILIRCWELPTERVQNIPNPVGFIKRVAVNEAYDTFKSGRHKYLVGSFLGEEHVKHAPDAEPIAIDRMTGDESAKEREMTIREAIRQLPPHVQRPLVLHYFHDRSVKQLAVQFGVSEGSIKMRLVRGRTQLEKLLRHTPVAPADWSWKRHVA